LLPDTVEGVMARRKLDRRTVLLCTAIALVAAVLAGIGAAWILDGTDDATATGTLELTDAAAIDPAVLLAVGLETPDGSATDLAALGAGDDRRTLVNFWQSTCAPCIEEMPMLEAASTTHPEVAFIGVAPLDQPDDAARLAEQTAITYPWALDPTGDLYAEAQGAGLPTTILLDEDGAVLVTKTGAFSSEAELEEFLAVGS
jgi:thiol-disulfide isomerase/thioredoxin